MIKLKVNGVSQQVDVPPVVLAIANAIFAATGQRIRELPFNEFFQI